VQLLLGLLNARTSEDCAPDVRDARPLVRSLDAANAMQIAKHERRYRDPKLGRDTFAAYFETFLAGAHNLRPRTRRIYADLGRLYLLPRLGAVRLDEIQPATVRRLIADVVSEGVGTRTRASPSDAQQGTHAGGR
jgi:hypothetical protein